MLLLLLLLPFSVERAWPLTVLARGGGGGGSSSSSSSLRCQKLVVPIPLI